MINDDKTFYHKALVWSAIFVLGDKTTCYCLSSLRNILSPYFTLNQNWALQAGINYCYIIVANRTFMSTLQPKTNRCNSVNSLIKKVSDLEGLPLSLKCTA